MSVLAIALRAILAYGTLLVLVRATGKQSVRQGTTVQFVIAIVAGDMVDDAILGESSVAAFFVAAVTLFATHWLMESVNYRSRVTR